MAEQSREEIRKKVAARVEEEQRDLSPDPPTPSGKDKGFDMAFIRKCYLCNEIGDSIIFNSLHREKHIFNTVGDRWYTWIDPHWEVDLNKRALADVEAVALQYISMLESIQDELDKIQNDKDKAGIRKSLNAKKKALIARLDRLRSARGRESVLRCAVSNAEPLTVHPDQLDQHPWLLPVANGVIDLRTGKERPGRPEDYLTMVSPVQWKGLDEPAPYWEKYLGDLLNNHQETIDFLLRTLGYALTGLNSERLFVVLFGKHGQSGKGTLMEILFHTLGKQLSGPIQAEMLLAQKFTKGADGPTPAVMALKGRRLAWASETGEGQSFSSEKLKLYSGGDPLVGRNPNDKDQTTFMPSHSLFLLTNSLPHAPAHDSAFWERIKVIDFPFSFVKRKPQKDIDGKDLPVVLEKHQRHADPELLENLKSESSGILASLVRGCIQWQKRGLDPPRKVLEDSLKYRRKEDDIQEFIEQCCHVNTADPDTKAPAGELYKSYRAWWEDVATTRPVSMKKFGDLMSMKFEKIKSSKVIYLGVMIDITKMSAGDKWGDA